MAIARKHHLTVIEDACHSWGATWNDQGLGTIGDLGVFSFQSSKNLTAGEGGFIATNNEDLFEKALSLHNCGRLRPRAGSTGTGYSVPSAGWYAHYLLGGNHRMTEMQGALLLSQLRRLKSQTLRRDTNGQYLSSQLSAIPGIRPMRRDAFASRVSYHLYIFRYDPATFAGKPRDKFIAALKAEGVPCSPGYPLPLYRQPLFLEKNFGPYTGWKHSRPNLDYSKVSCPACEKACAGEAVWIPQAVLLGSRHDMNDIVKAIAKVQSHAAEL